MTPERDEAILVAELRELAAAIELPAPGRRLTDTVMSAVADAAAPAGPPWYRRPPWAGRRLTGVRRRVLAAAIAVLLGLVAIPPVRAAVSDWFAVGGVWVHLRPDVDPSPSPPPPPAVTTSGLTMGQAAAAVGFPVLVPTALGRPDGVEVSADRRVVSMSWTTAASGVIRLDQFDGQLDYAFAKTASDAQFTTVADAFALFFDGPHEVVVLESDGTPRRASARLAGRTLIWTDGGWTARLEGELTLERAVEIARSTVPVP